MHRPIKKRITLILILAVLAFSVCAAAETPARQIYDSVFRLLSDTENVTLTGHAEFSLDGKRFKTADALYIQDGTRSLWQWDLLTPRADGSERKGGYTVIANGERVYVMEAFYPGVYRTGTTAESSTILRRSVHLNLLSDLLRILADQSGELLGEDVLQTESEEGGLTVRLQAGNDVPEMVNTALNLAVQFAAKRYFETDYDFISERYMIPMENYITVTQAILGSTYYMALQQADVTVKLDPDGNLRSADGTLSLELNTGCDGIAALDISFRLEVSDLGESRVATFSPSDYGVELAEDAMTFGDPGLEIPDAETEQKILEATEARLHLAGYTSETPMHGYVFQQTAEPDPADGRIYINFNSEDGSESWFCFTDSVGRLLGVQNMASNWQDTEEEWQSGEYPDPDLVKATEEKLLSYLAEENPELSADVLSLQTDRWLQLGEELFLHFWEGGEPVDHAWDEVDFIVRVAPEWRIELYTCIGNG